MSLQERTLVIKNFDPEKTTAILLKELCLQGGPVRNVVVRPDHAFVEFEDIESVGYCKALLENVEMFGQRLALEPKIRCPIHLRYTKILQNYINFDKKQQAQLQQAQLQQAQLQQQQQQQQAVYQQQIIAYSQQQALNTTPYQQYGAQPYNSSLQTPAVNFISNPRMFDPSTIHRQIPSSMNPNMLIASAATQINQQPHLYNPSGASTIQADPRMLQVSPSQQVYNSNMNAVIFNQTFNDTQPRLPQQQMPIASNINLNRSRSFDTNNQRPSGNWSRRR